MKHDFVFYNFVVSLLQNSAVVYFSFFFKIDLLL
jgi:hypothetical protein